MHFLYENFLKSFPAWFIDNFVGNDIFCCEH